MLDKASVEWAIDFVAEHSDGDLFPQIAEMRVMQAEKDRLANDISGKDLHQFPIGTSRRFIVPKDEISYRQATQLDPQDSIILSAIMHQFGAGVEQRRKPSDKVFSYRFSPSHDHGLYASQSGWNDFWAKVAQKSSTSSIVLYCDIADFYNQIYHHTVENQLMDSGFSNQSIKWVIRLLESTTAGVSRGIPVGPHAAHLIAEATLIPIDNSLEAQGIDFLRYADDILVFCSSQDDAREALSQIARSLDQQQRLTLQRHKTRFLSPEEAKSLCRQMVEDRPINRNERDLLRIVKRYSSGNPYRMISFRSIRQSDWKKIRDSKIDEIIDEYLSQDPVDFIRLRWFFRRLAQVGHPGAIKKVISRIHDLSPCLAGICAYLSSVQDLEEDDWRDLGEELVGLLTDTSLAKNEYFRLSVLSLFSRNATLNHISRIIGFFSSGDPYVRREVILSAMASGATDWLREHKEEFSHMDPWQKRAFIFACSKFPPDERQYFLGRFPQERVFDAVLLRWAKR
ncbi:Retron-type reverse transcriptase [Maritimibacter sp. DP07]|uniref:Retron-type reverse transcriptase n=1 Tax=Maritimibacter harenae TaxID=2606218 RepID=A0A845M2L6_9RHOB|nr:reverse transcriptase domain-containing protein [Maritimibacter harenae]MZR14590.1 Retron-type reverse transcriptase [Maritimibacter harenae]